MVYKYLCYIILNILIFSEIFNNQIIIFENNNSIIDINIYNKNEVNKENLPQFTLSVNSLIVDLNKDTDDLHHNITIYGVDNNDQAGYVIASADINCDNINDIIIGTLGATDGPNNKRIDSGEIYIIFGNKTLSPIEFLNQPDLVIYGGESYDWFGTALATGDVNGDGRNDIIISAIHGDGYGNLKTNCGEVYIIYGNDTFPSIWDLKTKPANVTIYGLDPGDQLGNALVSGDINNDGVDDIIIGDCKGKGPNNTRTINPYSCGEVYIVYGNSSLPPIINLTTSADITIYGADNRDSLGSSLAIGDVNSDNIDDLIIGAPAADGFNNLKVQSGEVYIIYGNTSLPSIIDLLYTPADMIIYGTDPLDRLGSVTSGDLNGDNIDDIIMSASGSRGANNSKFYNCGEVSVVFGNKTPLSVINSTEVDVIIYGIEGNDSMGFISTGNINGNDFDDLIIGAPAAYGPSNSRRWCGEIYIINGDSSLSSTIDLAIQSPNITIYGADGYDISTNCGADMAGSSVLISDINGDNIGEILIGAPNADGRDNENNDAGEIYIILSTGNFLPIPVIDSIQLINGAGDDKNICYANYTIPYAFNIKVTTPNNLEDLETVILGLAYDVSNINLKYSWTRATGQFEEVQDLNNLAKISNNSKSINHGNNSWTISFKIIFGWKYPDIYLHKVNAHSIGQKGYVDWLNLSRDIYRIENRLNFTGNLKVTGEYQGELIQGDWVRSDENISWTGLKIIYYETNAIYPPTGEGLFITISDKYGNNWFDEHEPGVEFKANSTTGNVTRINNIYTITISGISNNLDKSDVKFILNIDADTVTYSNYYPNSKNWNAILRPECGITIIDPSTNVSQLSVQYRTSSDTGITWSDWTKLGIQFKYNNEVLNCSVKPVFIDDLKIGSSGVLKIL